MRGDSGNCACEGIQASRRSFIGPARRPRVGGGFRSCMASHLRFRRRGLRRRVSDHSRRGLRQRRRGRCAALIRLRRRADDRATGCPPGRVFDTPTARAGAKANSFRRSPVTASAGIPSFGKLSFGDRLAGENFCARNTQLPAQAVDNVANIGLEPRSRLGVRLEGAAHIRSAPPFRRHRRVVSDLDIRPGEPSVRHPRAMPASPDSPAARCIARRRPRRRVAPYRKTASRSTRECRVWNPDAALERVSLRRDGPSHPRGLGFESRRQPGGKALAPFAIGEGFSVVSAHRLFRGRIPVASAHSRILFMSYRIDLELTHYPGFLGRLRF